MPVLAVRTARGRPVRDCVQVIVTGACGKPEWLLCRFERLAYSLGIACDDLEVRLSGLVGPEAPLLPIAQGTDRDTEDVSEFLLAEPDGPAHMLRERNTSHALQLCFGRRLSVGV